MPSRGRAGGQTGVTTLEAAASILVVLLAFGGMMEIVGASFRSDRMERAAHAAARAVALDQRDPDATACAAINRELDIDPDFDCTDRSRFPVEFKVDLGVAPDHLPEELLDSNGNPTSVTADTGDLVLVRVHWAGKPGPVTRVAMGLARAEP